MMTIYLPLLIFLANPCLAIEGYQNVIFQEQTEMSTTRARWLVTFTVDLRPYDAAFRSLEEGIKDIHLGAKDRFPQMKGLRGDATFQTLVETVNEEFEEIRDEHVRLFDRYRDYRSMTQRSKRSILPFVGKALSYLFGVTSEDDLRVVKKALGKLADTQGRVIHVVEDSISIMNITRHEVSGNRHKINALISSLKNIVGSFSNKTQALDRRVTMIEILTQRYWLYKVMVDRLRKYFLDVRMALDYLDLQLNLLSIGHLSPSIIAPHDLRELLHGVTRALPDNFKLASNPDKDIWHYYRTLTCTTLFSSESVVIVVEVPLLDREHSYVVYRILNFPLPVPTHSRSGMSSGLSARFDLESEMIAVNREGTRYILLDHAEAARCSASTNSLCEVAGPVYVATSRGSCEMSLFRRNPVEIERNCRVTIETNARLPIAIRIDQGTWVIATALDVDFVVLCGDKTRSRVVAPAPFATVRIDKGCTAYSDFMVLAAQINGNTVFRGAQQLQLTPLNVSSPAVWSPIIKKFPNFTAMAIPTELQDMEEIPVHKLLKALERVNVDRSEGMPIALFMGIGLGIGCLVILAGIIAKWWVGKRRANKTRTEERISLSVFNCSSKDADTQNLDKKVPSAANYPDVEAPKEQEKVRFTGPF